MFYYAKNDKGTSAASDNPADINIVIQSNPGQGLQKSHKSSYDSLR